MAFRKNRASKPVGEHVHLPVELFIKSLPDGDGRDCCFGSKFPPTWHRLH
ncbi:hypothetical protein HUA78_14270 [Myxococcus sp. CA033]|nr:hypothetical protein [Myxococcus sp. CA033]NTX35610.1 hypothetical protein [Myxococcus sp. CA033]